MTTTTLSAARINGPSEWLLSALYVAALLALIVAGGYLLWDMRSFKDPGGGLGVKIAYGALTATLLAACAGTLIYALDG